MDLQLDAGEVDELHELVVRLGMDAEAIGAAHRAFIAERLDAYLDDDELSWDELEQLRVLGRLLAADGRWLADLVEPVRPRRASARLEDVAGHSPDDTDTLAAPLSVCFTGEFTAMPLTRQQVQELAADAGMVVKSGVSRGLDVLVCLDPHAGTGKLRKAEAEGTVVVDQDMFLALAGVRVAQTGGILATVASRRRHRAAIKPTRPKRTPMQDRPANAVPTANDATEQTLWCESGAHEWRRPAQRGRPPKRCPEH